MDTNLEINNSQAPKKNRNRDIEPTITPSQNVRQSPEGEEAREEAKNSLNKLKEDIKEGKMSFELVKTYLESLDKLKNKSFKPYIIGGILSGLNQRGISIEGIRDGKINLKTGIQNYTKKLPIADHEETISYQNLINNYLSAGKISITDLNKALMLRTSSLDNYLKEKVNGQKTKTSEYVLRLLEKYKISVSGPSLETFKFETEIQYTSIKDMIKSNITDNQADKEFLLTYFDDIYYNGREGISEDFIEDYKKSSTKIEAGLFDGLNKLSEDQKYSLGIKSQDDAKEIITKWKNNPLEAVKEAFANGGGLLGLLLGLIGSAFWGKKGFLGGFIGGMALIGGGPAIAGEILSKGIDRFKGKLDKANSTREELSETNSLFNKFKGILEANSGNLDKKELLKIWNDLSKNDKFLKAPASLLKIFETERNEIKIIEELEKYGIKLSEKNKEFYKYIFSELVKNRNENIGEYKENETLKQYLERTSKAATAVATGATQGSKSEEDKTKTEQKTEVKTLGEAEKKQLLEYFYINSNNIKTLDGLGLDIYQFLNGYKNFIEVNLNKLDLKYKDKIKKSIGIKASIIVDKINELKAKELKQNNGSLGNFKNNRWIINYQIKDLFEKINTQVLPSAYILVQDKKTSESRTKEYKDKLNKTKKMFDSNLTDDGDFDKTFLSSFELLDSIRDNWEIFNTTYSKDLVLVNGIEKGLQNIDLLNDKDREIESDAMLAYLITAGIQVIPYAGTVVSIPAMTIDTFSDKDGTLSLLKTIGIIPEEYRMEKHIRDNLLGGVGLIATVFGIQGAVRGVKLAEKSNILKTVKFDKFEDLLQKISLKLGMSKEHTNFVSINLKKIFGVKENNSTSKVDDISFSKNGDNYQANIISRTPKSAKESANIFEQFFGKRDSIIKSLLPKKPGEELKIGDKIVKKITEGFEYNGIKYNKIDDILHILSKDITDTQLLAKINEGGIKNLNKLFNGISKQEIKIGEDTFRFRTESGKKIIEIKNGNGWEKMNIESLSEAQAQILLDRMLGVGVKEKIIGNISQKINDIKINHVISSSEKYIIIKRFGKGALEKLIKEFDDFMNRIPSKGDVKSNIYGVERFKEKGFGNAISGLLVGFKEGTWKTMLGGIMTNELWETYQAGGIKERYENYDIYTDPIDSIMNGILFKKVSLGRAIIAQSVFESTLGN